MAGYTHPTIVLEDDGFLPEDVFSPYQFFGGFGKEQGQPLYFNQLSLPDFWEIRGTNHHAEIYNMHRQMGYIHYAKPSHQRLIQAVDWYDESGKLRVTDRYNRWGKRYAQTSYDADGKPRLTSYFNAAGAEYLSEHHETGDLLLDWNGKTRVFHQKTDWIIFYLKTSGFDLDRIFFNSLGLPFLVAHRIGVEGRDILFWHEPIKEELPGNMRLLLDRIDKRPTKIIVQDHKAYQAILELTDADDHKKIDFLGFNYYFRKENLSRKSALTLTNSDQIPGLEELVQSCPDWSFHIGAITEMSSRLLDLSKYANVKLYPNISDHQVRQLYLDCDLYLDINEGNEILNAVRTAFDFNHVILGYSDLLHQPNYVPEAHRFDPSEVKALSYQLATFARVQDQYRQALEAQHHWAAFATELDYQDKIG